ncbi:MAG: oxygenase MpaB family protein, partial [Actinobacteria bacterium]|nr:oxygenase MpaB family protein [Actinomycetota bacterium]
MIRDKIALYIRALLSGAENGVPEWTPLVEAGDDAGLFKPTDAAWVVHADVATMIGGIRALLLQALHPGSLAGVMQHSRYEEDALGRLSGTIRWLTICTFGSKEALEVESARVRQMHERVKGKFSTNDGSERSYKASDSDLLMWVHVAFTDSFLAAHQEYGVQEINPDEYVKQWANAVTPIGILNPPQDLQELQAVLKSYEPQLRVDENSKRVIQFIQNPPTFTGMTKLVYSIMFSAAFHLLSEEQQKAIGV